MRVLQKFRLVLVFVSGLAQASGSTVQEIEYSSVCGLGEVSNAIQLTLSVPFPVLTSSQFERGSRIRSADWTAFACHFRYGGHKFVYLQGVQRGSQFQTIGNGTLVELAARSGGVVFLPPRFISKFFQAWEQIEIHPEKPDKCTLRLLEYRSNKVPTQMRTIEVDSEVCESGSIIVCIGDDNEIVIKKASGALSVCRPNSTCESFMAPNRFALALPLNGDNLLAVGTNHLDVFIISRNGHLASSCTFPAVAVPGQIGEMYGALHGNGSSFWLHTPGFDRLPASGPIFLADCKRKRLTLRRFRKKTVFQKLTFLASWD